MKVEAPEERILQYLEKKVISSDNVYTTPILQEVIEDSYKRLIAPAIEREIRSDLTEKAEDGAIEVFGKNLEQLLMQPPIVGQVVLGWDPAFRTGCKLAVVDATGKVLDTTVITRLHRLLLRRFRQPKETLKKLIRKYGITLVFSWKWNGLQRIRADYCRIIQRDSRRKCNILSQTRLGASVYSASKLATEEFPNFDVGQRSAASIARRLQDPLAELVKIDPKSIGVGQYQHDMNQQKIKRSAVRCCGRLCK